MSPLVCYVRTRSTELPVVVFYADTRVYGGAEYYLATLLASYDPERFKPRLVFTRWPEMGRLLAEFSRKGLEYDIIDAASVTSPWRQFWESFKYFRRVKPDVVHFNRTWNYGFIFPQLAARCAGVRRLVMTENLPEVLSRKRSLHIAGLLPGIGFWRWRRIFKRRLSVASINVVVSPTEASREILVAEYGYPRSKTVVIPYGIEFSAAKSCPHTVTPCATGFNATDLVIGAVGRLSRQKGFHHLLEAFKSTVACYPNTKLCIVGDGELRNELEAYITDNNLSASVRLLGHRSNLPDLFPCFDVFAFPSIFESAGIALLEAMSFGLAVVASDLREFQGVVEPYITGLVVPPGNAGSLAAAVNILLADRELRRRLGGQAQAHVRRLFSVASCVDRTYSLYAHD